MATPISQQKQLTQRIDSNHDHYWMATSAFYQHTNRQEALRKWTEEQFESYVVNVLSESFDDKLGEPLRVLGVGSSEGSQEIIQLKNLKNKFSRISASVIEPSKQKISKYQETVNQKNSDFTGIKYEWHNQTFQEYIQYMRVQKKYHYITIIHTMYFLGDVEQAVRNLHELLEPGGVIFMVLGTDYKGIGNLFLTFPDLHKVAASSKTSRVTNSTDIISVLTKYQIGYTKSSYTESTDITTCYTHKESTEAGLLLDALTATMNFKEVVPQDIFKDVMDFIKRNTRVKKGDQRR
ncbi:histamine N-methyltransferase-like [Amphiura filiformis]|uniref:histamine N-methyltransferase-like n=1 Tax=Amphiura filiformis TaxID=82378 RepID=UPI003B21A5FA